MKAIVTVIGQDQIGIIARVCTLLASHNVNVLDISQTVMQGYFTMIMLVDTSLCELSFSALRDELEQQGKAQQLEIRILREDIFSAMHRV